MGGVGTGGGSNLQGGTAGTMGQVRLAPIDEPTGDCRPGVGEGPSGLGVHR